VRHQRLILQHQRRNFWVPILHQPPHPPPTPSPFTSAGARPTGSAADSWPHDVSLWLSKGTVEVSSDAMFLLAVLSSTGIASRIVPKDDARVRQHLGI